MRKALPTPLLIAVLIGALLGSGLVRGWVNHRRADVAATDTLARLDSFALGLLLGGFRGPLVMVLWNSTESQKTSRDLADFNTQLELIRLLQPQFDSVHIYQVWNKAYNQSAQVASLPTKYAIILDAIDYAQSVDAERRPDIDIKEAIGQIYFQKLGIANEAPYYDQRLRTETRADQPLVRVSFPANRLDEFKRSARAAGVSTIKMNLRTLPDGRRSVTLTETSADLLASVFTGDDVQREPRQVRQEERHPPLLDEAGNVLPVDQLPGGVDLPFLRPFEPYLYGVPAHAIAHDYFQEALELQLNQQQQHTQLSSRVISARPGLSLREWAENAFEQGRVAELEYVDAPSPETSEEREVATGEVPTSNAPRTALFDEALWHYQRVAEVVTVADAEFAAHIDRFPNDRLVYQDDRHWLGALQSYARADVAYLRLTQATDPAERQALAREARANYNAAGLSFARYLARYHTVPFIVTEVGLQPGRYEATDVSPAAAAEIVRRSRRAVEQDPQGYEHAEEVKEFGAYLDRIARRLELLDAAGL